MRALFVLASLLSLQCSSSSKPVLPVDPPPPVGSAGSTPAPADAEPDDEGFGYTGYHFEWQQLREDRDAFLKTPIDEQRCDTRRSDFKPTFMCQGPYQLAGLVVRIQSGNSPPVRMVVDVGPREGLSKEWTAALLDETGKPVTGWVPVTEMRDRETSIIEFPIKYADAIKWTRVGLRIDLKLRDEISRRNTGHYH